jgi:hypothetical protein
VSPLLALLMAVGGGAFGTLAALTIFFFFVRSIIKAGFDNFIKTAHEKNQCPICKQPFQHDHSGDEKS